MWIEQVGAVPMVYGSRVLGDNGNVRSEPHTRSLTTSSLRDHSSDRTLVMVEGITPARSNILYGEAQCNVGETDGQRYEIWFQTFQI